MRDTRTAVLARPVQVVYARVAAQKDIELIKDAIKKVIERKDLTKDEASSVMDEIMTGAATPSQITAVITALRMKGETVDEITGFALKMREHAVSRYTRK